MKGKKIMGAVVASTIAGLFFAGKVMAEEKAEPEAKKAEVKCAGINACSGKGACKGTDNACNGKNACKGKGWVSVGSEKECTDKGGKVVAAETKETK